MTNLKVRLSELQPAFSVFFTPLQMHLKLRHDVAMATWRRTKDCVAMQQALRRDVI